MRINMMKKISVQISAPIRQKPQVLDLFLSQFLYLEKINNKYQFFYYFIDDNIDYQSSALLTEFSRRMNKQYQKAKCIIAKPKYYFSRLDDEDVWNWEKIQKVGAFRNNLLDHAKKQNSDYVFMVDSDILLHPNTISKLIDQKKDIITQLHWTEINGGIHPNVWLYDFWDFAYRRHYGEHISRAKQLKRMQELFYKLDNVELFKVGGLCGCCLISKSALVKGVGYDQIYNLNTASEDYHFSVRAAALGIPLYVYTINPAFHIFTDKLPYLAVVLSEPRREDQYIHTVHLGNI